MRSTRSLLLCLFLQWAVASVATAPGALDIATPEASGFSSARLNLAHQMLGQHIEDGRISGLVAGVARQGKVVYLESMGWSYIEEGIPMQSDSIFQIRSMSKAITAVAAMQLVEQGKMNLQDPVAKFIPDPGGMQVFLNPESGTSVVIMLQVQPADAFNIASKFKALVYQSMID